ncbi:hypothetical protein SRHO_G00330920 [Serrasalmus rhombeus]
MLEETAFSSLLADEQLSTTGRHIHQSPQILLYLRNVTLALDLNSNLPVPGMSFWHLPSPVLEAARHLNHQNDKMP